METLQEEIELLMREHSIKVANWEQQLLAQAILEALKAGDFQKFCMMPQMTPEGQTLHVTYRANIVYQPYARVLELQREVSELELTCAVYRTALKEIRDLDEYENETGTAISIASKTLDEEST